jgi:predicted XRE-type DNA-binding protein
MVLPQKVFNLNKSGLWREIIARYSTFKTQTRNQKKAMSKFKLSRSEINRVPHGCISRQSKGHIKFMYD